MSALPPDAILHTARLTLTPLREADAESMLSVLAGESLFAFTGGTPPTGQELRERYARQVVGWSPDGDEQWLNWIVRLRPPSSAADPVGGVPIGTVQATVTLAGRQAELAWVVGEPWQGHGYAREAAVALAGWLRQQGVATLVAHVHPRHLASQRVAAHAGLAVSDAWQDGEQRWTWPPSWWLDELVTIGAENIDPVHVAAYDRKEDAAAEAEIAVLAELGLGPDSVMIEFGAGTGQLAVRCAPLVARYVAVDPSPLMCRTLQHKATDAGSPASLEIVQAGFLSYQHSGAPADVVYSRLALHHLPDFWKALALARARSMVRIGGVLRLWDVVFSFPVIEAQERITRWRDQVEQSAGEWRGSDVDDHLRDEHSTFTWLLEPMIEQAGFRIEDRTYTADGLYASYVARAL
jgi:RimJ/RimL family protein N-acetyltransferase/ubiquinone/menaquinone biosynthesis C-methylase UbiE